MNEKNPHLDVNEVIRYLGLSPHPKEGGWFVETYRSVESIPRSALPTRYAADRSFGTAIYYLLTPDTRSEVHRLASDEVFHFYAGDPVRMVNLHPDGSSDVVVLGSHVLDDERVQHVVPHGTWQGAHLVDGGSWALLGCTVAPGFDYTDYEAADRAELLKRYPDRRELILRLT